jgi:hypothetical protein
VTRFVNRPRLVSIRQIVAMVLVQVLVLPSVLHAQLGTSQGDPQSTEPPPPKQPKPNEKPKPIDQKPKPFDDHQPPRPGGPLGADFDSLLRTHPDIRMAEAKLAIADAELKQVRFEVMRQALALKFKVDQAREVFDLSSKMLRLSVHAGVAGEELLKREAETAKAWLLLRQATEDYEMFVRPPGGMIPPPIKPPAPPGGFPGAPGGPPAGGPSGPPAASQPDEPDAMQNPPRPGQEVDEQMFVRVSKLLSAKITYGADQAVSLSDALSAFNEQLPKDARVTLSFIGQGMRDLKVEIPKGTFTGRGLMQLITDQHPEVSVVVRRYGLLVTTNDRVPSNALSWDDIPDSHKE